MLHRSGIQSALKTANFHLTMLASDFAWIQQLFCNFRFQEWMRLYILQLKIPEKEHLIETDRYVSQQSNIGMIVIVIFLIVVRYQQRKM